MLAYDYQGGIDVTWGLIKCSITFKHCGQECKRFLLENFRDSIPTDRLILHSTIQCAAVRTEGAQNVYSMFSVISRCIVCITSFTSTKNHHVQQWFYLNFPCYADKGNSNLLALYSDMDALRIKHPREVCSECDNSITLDCHTPQHSTCSSGSAFSTYSWGIV